MDEESQEASPRALRLKEELLGDFSLRVDDVAVILEVDRSTVNRYIQDGGLVALKIGREYRLSEADVRDFVQELVARERRRVGGLRMRALSGDGEGRGATGTHFAARFSEEAQKALASAQGAARARQAEEVLPEHLLLGLLAAQDPAGGATAVLRAVVADVDALRGRVEGLLPPAAAEGGGDGQDLGQIGFGTACRDLVLERAPALARAAGRENVGPEDLLMALYAVRTVGDLLRAAGAPEAAVRVELGRLAPAPPLSVMDQPLRDDVTALSVWVQACEEARRRDGTLVSPPHLLLAMLSDAPGLREGPARRVLEAVGADIEILRAGATAAVPPGVPIRPGAIVLSRGGYLPSFWGSGGRARSGGGRTQAPISRALREADYHAFHLADALGHAQVGAEHLLLGLLALPDLAQLLASAGAREPELREAVWRMRADVPPLGRELSCDFNNVGITDDDNAEVGDLDGGGRSYSRQELAAAGLTAGAAVDVDGMRFEWPAAGPGVPDNVLVMGQVVPLAVPPGAQRLGFLGTASEKPASGAAALVYDDGGTQRFTLTFGDWVRGGEAGRVVAGTTYWHTRGGPRPETTHVYFTSVPLRVDRVPVALQLPAQVEGGRMHLFALAAG